MFFPADLAEHVRLSNSKTVQKNPRHPRHPRSLKKSASSMFFPADLAKEPQISQNTFGWAF
jgi:hypothetical protein